MKLIDLDGSFTHSDVAPVCNGAAVAQGMNVFPDPTSGTATRTPQGLREGSLTALVVNGQGQQMLGLSRSVMNGDLALSLELEGLPAGMYLVRVAQSDALPREIRLLKQ